MPEIAIVVPARLASVRFPRKLLFEIQGKPVLQWTAERVAAQAPEMPLYFAVAEEELATLLRDRGYQAIMTDPGLASGTDRIAEANREIGADYIINVQADEPMVTATQIETLRRLIAGPADIATLATTFEREEDFRDPNKVKVVINRAGNALYFSRSPIPFARDHQGYVDPAWLREHRCYWHLGMYAYTAGFLNEFHQLPVGVYEGIEKLEQLRALENGYTISVGHSAEHTVGVDTPEDAEEFRLRVEAGTQ